MKTSATWAFRRDRRMLKVSQLGWSGRERERERNYLTKNRRWRVTACEANGKENSRVKALPAGLHLTCSFRLRLSHFVSHLISLSSLKLWVLIWKCVSRRVICLSKPLPPPWPGLMLAILLDSTSGRLEYYFIFHCQKWVSSCEYKIGGKIWIYLFNTSICPVDLLPVRTKAGGIHNSQFSIRNSQFLQRAILPVLVTLPFWSIKVTFVCWVKEQVQVHPFV